MLCSYAGYFLVVTCRKLLIFLRLIANILVIIVLASSSYAIYLVVERSKKFEQDLKEGKEVSWYERNEVRECLGAT